MQRMDTQTRKHTHTHTRKHTHMYTHSTRVQHHLVSAVKEHHLWANAIGRLFVALMTRLRHAGARLKVPLLPLGRWRVLCPQCKEAADEARLFVQDVMGRGRRVVLLLLLLMMLMMMMMVVVVALMVRRRL